MNSELSKAGEIPVEDVICFEGFSFIRDRMVLMEGDRVVALPPKTCELLAVLLENRGEVLSKNRLMEEVWKDTFVEESNLTHHIAALRKALGGGKTIIETVPRRGYRFTAAVTDQASVRLTVTEKWTTETIETIEIEDAPLPVPMPVGFRSSRRKFVALAAVVALAACVLLVIGLSWGDRTSNGPKPVTISRITNSNVVNSASISPDGKFVAYIRNWGNGDGKVYIRQAGTNIERELATHAKGTFGTTAFSPDGAFVYYAVNDRVRPVYCIYRVPVVGGMPVLMASLTDSLESTYFSLAPDGLRAAVTRSDRSSRLSSVIEVKLDGSGAERVLLTRSFDELQILTGGSWSPDGSRIVLPVTTAKGSDNYTRNVTGLFEFELATGELRQMTDETWAECGITRWMPDSSGVIVIAKKPRMRNQIYFLSYPSGKVSRITNDSNGYSNYGLGITADGRTSVTDIWEFDARIWKMDSGGDSSTAMRFQTGNPIFTNSGLTDLPDGRVVYSTRTNLSYDLWIMDADGKETRPLTSDPFFESNPIASPDGTFLVFSSDRAGEGSSHLFRINTDGSGLRQLTFGPAFDDVADISPDGKWIIFHSGLADPANSSPVNSIRRVSAEGGESVELVRNCFAPSFSPDSGKFACTVPIEPYRGTIRIYETESLRLLRSTEVEFLYHEQLPVRWTPDGSAVIFRAQRDQVGNLWKLDLDSSVPEKFTDFGSDIIYNFTFTRNGKNLIVSRGNVSANVVVFTDFMETRMP